MVEKAFHGDSIKSTAALWLTYQNIAFSWCDAPCQADTFAVVTAWNPRSRVATDTQNSVAQTRLLQTVNTLGAKAFPLAVGNSDFSYFEESYAITCDITAAAQLCRQYMQNGFYWIEDGLVYLHPVLFEGYKVVCIGAFADRLRQ